MKTPQGRPVAGEAFSHANISNFLHRGKGVPHFFPNFASQTPHEQNDMQTKRLISLLALSLAAVLAAAQPVARFSETRHEFGSLTWQMSGMATFKVTNTGDAPLLISNVRTDCGCTAVSWPHEAIQPGGTGSVCVTYDAELLGSFQKSVAVYTNAAPAPTYLVLSGEVVIQKQEYTGDFPYQIGDIYLSTDNLEFDDVNRGDMPEKVLLVYNNGKKPYRPELMHLPKYLEASYEPAVIRAGRVGRVVVRLNSELLRTMGLTQTDIYLSRFPGDRVKKENEINVSATLLPEANWTPAQLAAAPVAHLDSTVVNMGSLGKKKKLKAELLLTNKGKSDLEIRALQVYNPGLGVSIGKRKLKPGEKGKLKITLNANSNYFKGRRRILLITNDPENSKIVIDLIVKK